MDSTRPRRTIVALTAIALLALPTTAAASAGNDYSKNAATGAYERGPLPPPGPAKDYEKNAATGAYSGWPRNTNGTEAARRTQPVGPAPAQAVTIAKPSGFDWSDAAIGATVGIALAFCALGLTALARRRRIVSPAAREPSRVAQ